MPRTAITPLTLDKSGLKNLGSSGTEYGDANGVSLGYSCPFSEDMILLARNTDSSDHTVTLQSPVALDGNATVAKPAITIPAGKQVPLWPIPGSVYRQADGNLYWQSDSALMKFQALSKF